MKPKGYHCSRCGQSGHNTRSCGKAPVSKSAKRPRPDSLRECDQEISDKVSEQKIRNVYASASKILVSEEEIHSLDEQLVFLENIRWEISQMSDEKLNSMDWAIFARKMRFLNPQSWGNRLEKYFINYYGWTKIPSKEDRGDAMTANGLYIEIKSTYLTTVNNKANFVQIRQHQNLDGYCFFVIKKDYSIVRFDLSKKQMEKELALMGTTAHGTQKATKNNKNKEEAIRIEYGSEDWNRWVRKYSSSASTPDSS